MKPRSLAPLAHVRSVARSIEFYRKLGFEVGNTHTPEGGREPVWAWLRSADAHLMVALASHPVEADKQAVLFHIYCPDVAGFRDQLLREGVDTALRRLPRVPGPPVGRCEGTALLRGAQP